MHAHQPVPMGCGHLSLPICFYSESVFACVCVCVRLCVIYVNIYTLYRYIVYGIHLLLYRESERQREREVVCVCEREREGERDRGCAYVSCVTCGLTLCDLGSHSLCLCCAALAWPPPGKAPNLVVGTTNGELLVLAVPSVAYTNRCDSRAWGVAGGGRAGWSRVRWCDGVGQDEVVWCGGVAG